MIGQNIKRLRLENHMTQKQLADKLFVTAQAVSRWENGDVEPSLSTLAELARIFGVSTDEILGVSGAEDFPEDDIPEEEEYADPEPEENTRKKYYEERPQILALCDKCNSPIYSPADIFRYRDVNTGAKGIRCKACEQKFKRIVAERAQLLSDTNNRKKLKKAKRARIKNIAFAAFLVLILVLALVMGIEIDVLGYLGGALIWIAFLGTIFFRNTKFGRMLHSITTWHDFSEFDFGILNLLFLAFDLLVLVISFIVAVIVGMFSAPVFYVIAIIRNIKHPECTMLDDFWSE